MVSWVCTVLVVEGAEGVEGVNVAVEVEVGVEEGWYEEGLEGVATVTVVVGVVGMVVALLEEEDEEEVNVWR